MLGVCTPDSRHAAVLVVEDHPDFGTVISQLLQSQGYDVELAPDIQSSVERVRNANFEAALCDMHLPDGDGFQLVARLHSIRPELAAIAYSADWDRFTEQKALQAGYSACVNKDVNPIALLETLGQAISTCSNARRLHRPKPLT